KRSVVKNPDSYLYNVVFNPDLTLAAGIDDRDFGSRVYIWDTRSGTLRATLKDFTLPMRFVRFSPTSQKLMYGGNSGVWLLDVPSNSIVTLTTGRGYTFGGFFEAGKKAYAGGDSFDYAIWDTASGKVIATGHDAPYGRRKSMSPDGKTLAIGRGDGTILLIDS